MRLPSLKRLLIKKEEKMTKLRWQYDKKAPPDWVIQAFHNMGADYEYIARNFAKQIDVFRVDVASSLSDFPPLK